MAKVLVVDDERDIRASLVDILFYAGYDVIEAEDGGEAIEQTCTQYPDIILMDVMMPVMDGLEALRKLRDNPDTEAIPVILLTAVDAAKAEGVGMSLGVKHYITKPFDPDIVEGAIRVSLRDSGTITTPVRTGETVLDEKLGGGIPLGSLTLVEGDSSAGKSVICQHLAYGAAEDGHKVAYFTSESDVRGLVSQMDSLGLDGACHVRAGNLRIDPMELSPTEDDVDHLANLLRNISALPRRYKIIFVDTISNLVVGREGKSAIDFFSSCKGVCRNGRTVILVAHSHVFEEQLFTRIRSLCDVHLSLRVEKKGLKLLKTLEIVKVLNANQITGNVIPFEVEPGLGIRLTAFKQITA